MKITVKQLLSNRFFVLGLVILGFILVFSIFEANQSIDIRGNLTLHTNEFNKNEACGGTGGYSDIAGGAQVKVSGADDKIIKLAELQAGKADEFGDCIFAFTIKGVPNSDVYQIEVSHRGKTAYSKDDLVEKGYKIELSLGE